VADDIAKWLAAARPNTAADNGWATSPAGDRALSGVLRAANRRRAHAPWRWASRLSVQRVGLVAAAALLVAAIATPGDSRTNRTPPPPLGALPHPADMALVAYNSCDDMLTQLRRHTAASVGLLDTAYRYQAMDRAGGVPLGSAPSPANKSTAQPSVPAHSTTNIQESGVDEPDIVKSDGTRIVSVTGGVLRVIDTATKKITGKLTLAADAQWTPSDLLVAGDRALVILQPDVGYEDGGPIIARPMPYDAPGRTSKYVLIDLSGAPRVLDSISADGHYVDARMVGSTVRLVVRSSPNIALPNDYSGYDTAAKRIAHNKATVLKAPLTAWLPTYDVTVGGVKRTKTVPCSRISHPVEYTGTSMLTIYTIDLARGLGDTSPVSLAADGDTVYGTSSSLYITSNPAWWSCCIAYGPIERRPGLAPKQPAQRTQIHRFDITSPGAPRYLGSGSVPGRLLNQYSLSDYDGHLRVATTSSANAGPSSSSVYVLAADTLAVTGHVSGLGKGEQLYAVRFAGPLGYVVTFRQTDPLFVLDLHDPAAPQEVGELKLTGFSSYLHPIGDGRLIGVGQEANARGMVAGLQVSLFDVSKPSEPQRVARVQRPEAPGEFDVDPHAFLYWPATGLVVVPVQSWQATEAGKALVLKVTGSGLATVGLISQRGFATTQRKCGDCGIQRTLVVGDSIWTLSNSGIQVSSMGSLRDVAWIPFD
jgi:uncharacterized secreted protein with C-terminal beta-propeller domain